LRQILHVLALLGACKFLDLRYTAQSNYDHVTKFYVDWSMELGDLALNKKHLW